MFLVLGEALLVGFLAGGDGQLPGLGHARQLQVPDHVLRRVHRAEDRAVYGPLLGMAVSFAGSIVPAMTAKNVKVAEVFAKVA